MRDSVNDHELALRSIKNVVRKSNNADPTHPRAFVNDAHHLRELKYAIHGTLHRIVKSGSQPVLLLECLFNAQKFP